MGVEATVDNINPLDYEPEMNYFEDIINTTIQNLGVSKISSIKI